MTKSKYKRAAYLVCAVCFVLLSILGSALLETHREEANRVVRANLLNIREYARAFYTTPDTYAKVCSDRNVREALLAAEQAGGGEGECNFSFLGWAISVPLRGKGYFCVDFEGKDMHRGSILGIDVTC